MKIPDTIKSSQNINNSINHFKTSMKVIEPNTVKIHSKNRKIYTSSQAVFKKSLNKNDRILPTTRWNELMKTISFNPKSPNYYNELPIKPKIGFYIALTNEKYPISNLNVLIPNTLIKSGNKYRYLYFSI